MSRRLDASIDEDFNLLVFMMLLVAFFGGVFLDILKVDSGHTVAILFLGGIAVMFLVFMFLKQDDSLIKITKFLKIPISTSLPLTCMLYLVGLGIPILLKLIFVVLNSGFSITSFSIPLFGGDITSNFQSFATSEISGSMPWKEFIMVYVAGTNETWLFNFILPLAMVLVGLLLYELLTDDKNYIFGFIRKEVFIIGVSFLLSSGLFTVLHTFNSTYNSFGQYAFAFLFLLIANLSIFLFGIFLAFWIGFHQMNNLIWLIEQEGLAKVLTGMFSFFGVIFVGSIILIIFYLLRNPDRTKKDFLSWWHR